MQKIENYNQLSEIWDNQETDAKKEIGPLPIASSSANVKFLTAGRLQTRSGKNKCE